MKYEYKYIVPVSRMNDLREAFCPFVEMDPYARCSENHEYTVRSIYFDTPQFCYYFEKLDGYKVRKKLRIRGYNDQIGDDIVFLEIKRKMKEPIEKMREKMTFEDVIKLMDGGGLNGDADDHRMMNGNIIGTAKFLYYIHSQNLKPVILVIYDREAFFDRFTQDVRLTIDKNLRSIPYPGIADLFNGDAARYVMKDHFIFEVKFTGNFPFWLRPVLARMGLVKRSASKYVMCLDSHKLTEKITPGIFCPSGRYITI